MVKVLFITEKYHSEKNPTNNMWNLIGSYKCSGYGEYEHCFIDPEEIWSSAGVDHVLMTRQYDAAIISVYHHLPSRSVAQQVGHKSCMLWWDAVVSMGGVLDWSRHMHQICFDWGKGEEYPNVFCLEVPQDTSVFYPDHSVEEDIDISFAGSLDAPRPDRAALVNRLRDAGLSVWAGGGRGPGRDNLPLEEYVNIFRKSKICLCPSWGHGRPQRKGRCWEISAVGQFMMFDNGFMYRGKDGDFFTDGVEYVSYDDTNVIDKIKYYLEHKEERDTIAANCYRRYVEEYAPKPFWKKLLNICGITIN